MVTWINALSRTRRNIAGALSRLLGSSRRPADISPEELEDVLLGADVPVRLAATLVEEIEKGYHGLNVSRKDVLRTMLSGYVPAAAEFQWTRDPGPLVILVVGVNGSGKTTTCAKLAHQAMQKGLKPVLGATDTFRAAGADQLKLWAGQLGCDVVAGTAGADAAAVAFDALDAAIARKADVLIIDTAGRMHTKEPLMRELQKVRGAISKRLPGAPHEVLIVLDATIGQNAVVQARVFHEAVPLTGAIVSKLDGSSKAGFLFSVTRELEMPVRFAGLGEGRDDLVPFDPQQFVNALLADEADAPARPG